MTLIVIFKSWQVWRGDHCTVRTFLLCNLLVSYWEARLVTILNKFCTGILDGCTFGVKYSIKVWSDEHVSGTLMLWLMALPVLYWLDIVTSEGSNNTLVWLLHSGCKVGCFPSWHTVCGEDIQRTGALHSSFLLYLLQALILPSASSEQCTSRLYWCFTFPLKRVIFAMTHFKSLLTSFPT